MLLLLLRRHLIAEPHPAISAHITTHLSSGLTAVCTQGIIEGLSSGRGTENLIIGSEKDLRGPRYKSSGSAVVARSVFGEGSDEKALGPHICVGELTMTVFLEHYAGSGMC